MARSGGTTRPLQPYWCNRTGRIGGSIPIDCSSIVNSTEIPASVRNDGRRGDPVSIHTFTHATAPESDVKTDTSWPAAWIPASVVALAVAASAISISAILVRYNSAPGIVIGFYRALFTTERPLGRLSGRD